MKKSLLLLFLLFVILGFSQGKPLLKHIETLDEKIQKKIKIEKDVFDDLIIIRDKKTSGQNIRIKPYLVIKDNLVYYRVAFVYDGFDWLNYNAFKFLINDQVLEIPINSTRKEISYKISAVESTNILLSDSEIEIFNKIANAKTPIKYRISGEKNVDLKLYENDYIKNINDLYYLLTN